MQMKNNSKKENVDISKLYGEDCIISTQEFIDKHHINKLEGLSSDTASDNISKYGYNELKQAKEKKNGIIISFLVYLLHSILFYLE